jgi:hypothetical protein
MDNCVDPSTFHKKLVGELLRRPPTKAEAMCLMLLLHACRIVLSARARVVGGIKGFEGITTRHAADVVASLFHSGDEASAHFWYHKWNSDWRAYEILENPSVEVKMKVKRIQWFFEAHPWVERIEDEDWTLLS